MMKLALEQAAKSGNDIAIGAVVVKDGKIISSAHNRKEITQDVTGHAEIIAIKEAAKKLGNWRLKDCEIYVTLEPCPMCAWAIIQSGMKAVYFGSYDRDYGALGSKIDLRTIAKSKLKVYGGILEAECDNLLKVYFKKIRKK